jgi:hypothetical protein
MLHFQEFDLKTGKIFTNFNPDGEPTERTKDVEGEYLEVWLTANKIQPQGLYVATYYQGIDDLDRQRRETEGKYLVYTSKKAGYFTDRETAIAIAKGDTNRQIEPIFANSPRSAHNAVAYGSLLIGDEQITNQIAKQIEGKVRLLIVDNQQRSLGTTPLIDRDGRVVPDREVATLLDKMGDGNMLATTEIGRGLMTDGEILKAIDGGLKKQPDCDLGEPAAAIDEAFRDEVDPELRQSLLEEFRAHGKVTMMQIPDDIAKSINAAIDRAAESSILQFHAATPSLPGVIKGTAATSKWCERLVVDVIISTDSIKGDDGRLKQLGIQEYERGLWIYRKGIAKDRTQQVGMQIKVMIPAATLTELNPIAEAKLQDLTNVAASNWRLAQYYVDKKDRQQAHQEDTDPAQEQPIHTILKADTYGQMSQQPVVAKELKKSLRQDRLNAAISGIEIPSATAQHHSQLEPWEICCRALPHGAVVAYYHSPLPNAGAVGIGVNNLDVLNQADPEAYNKRGAIYINPWTAKNVVITDADGVQLAIFVGGVDPELPAKLRQQLGNTSKVCADCYELGRAALALAIDRVPATQYTSTVKAFIDANHPDRKPLAIAKAKQVDYPWQEGESLTAATFRAWGIVVVDRIGKVVEQAIVLQSLAAQTHYIDDAKKPTLLKIIGRAYSKIDPTIVPSNDYLESLGLPKMGLQEKIDRVVTASARISTIPAAEQLEFATENLNLVCQIVRIYADSAVALNLQTAVGAAKSAKVIDEGIHKFGNALQYQNHELRLNMEAPEVYLKRGLKNNVSDPIGFLVNTANKLYESSSALQELDGLRLDERFKRIVPATHSDVDDEIVKKYLERYDRCLDAVGVVKKRLSERVNADAQPTISIVTSSGKTLVVQRTIDADEKGDSPIWNESSGQSEHEFEIALAPNNAPEKYAVYLVDKDKKYNIGYITSKSATANQLNERKIGAIEDPAFKPLAFQSSKLEFLPPYVLQNDRGKLYYSVDRVLAELTTAAADRRAEFASALWHSRVDRRAEFASGSADRLRGGKGMNVAIWLFPEIIASNLDRAPTLILNELTDAAKNISHDEIIAIRIERDLKLSLIGKDGSTQPLGAMNIDQNVILDPGMVLEVTASKKFARGDKIRVATELGEFVVNPCKAIEPGEISDVYGKFEFDTRDPKGKEAYVHLIEKDKRIYLGTLGKESTNKPLKAELGNGVKILNGKMSRRFDPDTIQLDVIHRIDRHDVAKMDRGERIPLPLDFVMSPTVSSGDLPIVETYNPTIGELRQSYKDAIAKGDEQGSTEIVQLGKTLKDLYPYPWTVPSDYRHPDVILLMTDRCLPTSAEANLIP